ncbi:hypothetical protein GCM10027058_29460 [Microbacterium neimengense]
MSTDVATDVVRLFGGQEPRVAGAVLRVPLADIVIDPHPEPVFGVSQLSGESRERDRLPRANVEYVEVAATAVQPIHPRAQNRAALRAPRLSRSG